MQTITHLINEGTKVFQGMSLFSMDFFSYLREYTQFNVPTVLKEM